MIARAAILLAYSMVIFAWPAAIELHVIGTIIFNTTKEAVAVVGAKILYRRKLGCEKLIKAQRRKKLYINHSRKFFIHIN